MDTVIRSSPRWQGKKALWLGVSFVVVAAVLVWLAWRSGLPAEVDAAVRALRTAGPIVFFLAMAVLPAAGFPLMAFALAVGPLFTPTLGTGWVLVWSLAAIVVNLLLSYWLAHWALRPLVSRLLGYFDYQLPAAAAASGWRLTLIARLTPGPPFWAVSCLLALLRVPLRPYLVVSTGVMAGYLVALVFGGAAIAEGYGQEVFATIGIGVAGIATLRLLRRRTAQRKRAATLLLPVPILPVPSK